MENVNRCYNPNCLNRDLSGAPMQLPADHFAQTGTFYCSAECKALVVGPEYDQKRKPRTIKEMQLRLKQMKQDYLLSKVETIEKKD